MASLLLAVIYVAFISLGLPDSLLGSAWPTMSQDLNVPVAWAGGISAVISMFTIVSALLSDRMTLKFGAGKVTAVSVALTAAALAGFSVTSNYWVLLAIAIPYGLGAGGVDAAPVVITMSSVYRIALQQHANITVWSLARSTPAWNRLRRAGQSR